MSVKVPIIDRSTTRKRRIRSRPNILPQISDLQFLKSIIDGDVGKTAVFEVGINTGAGNVITVTAPTGTTFFFLGAVADVDTADGDYQLTNNGIVRELTTIVDGNFYEFKLPMDKLVGNSSDSFILESLTALSVSRCSLWGWFENTKKI